MTKHVSSAQKCLLAAATLAAGATLDRWSRAVAFAAIIALILSPKAPIGVTAVFWLSLCAGMTQMYCALRTALDERVFSCWSTRWERDEDETAEADDLAAFDAALHDQFGKTPVPRDLDQRIAAAMRLPKRQALAFGAQIFLLTLALVLRYIA